MSKDIDG